MLGDDGPQESTPPEHDAGKMAPAKHWEGYGFTPTEEAYMVYEDLLITDPE
ncbi:hypothetical protein ACQCSX_01865 [Pseudarthrobacter sp. P1]|uniref:hypothetical protein n=1 Tax=Pseudarthrobacter sp. P1 TaxID=3418418 RepID=UPI003CF82A84